MAGRGQWNPRRQHRSGVSLSSGRQGVPKRWHRSLRTMQGAEGPEKTAQVLLVPDQPAGGSASQEESTGPAGSVAEAGGSVS